MRDASTIAIALVEALLAFYEKDSNNSWIAEESLRKVRKRLRENVMRKVQNLMIKYNNIRNKLSSWIILHM